MEGVLESGRKQKISDLESTFHALYTIIRCSHIGARGTENGIEAENGIASVEEHVMLEVGRGAELQNNPDWGQWWHELG